jgi:uncharacterized protein (DUF2252 family)
MEMANLTKQHSPVIAPGTPAERKAAGRALRAKVPMRLHGKWLPAADRPDPVTVLQARDEGRLEHLLPLKYRRMAKSPFAFLRGSAAVMASDLSTVPSTGIQTQLCGDAHIDNFGVFASPERRLVFDVNDFDETLPGPWEWDLKRLAASAVVTGRGLGFSDRVCRDAVAGAVGTYARVMASLSKMTALEVWYYSVDVEHLRSLFSGSTRKASAGFRRMLSETRKSTHAQALNSLTKVTDGHRRFVVRRPFLAPLTELAPDRTEAEIERAVEAAWNAYVASVAVERRALLERYRVADAAMLVGGVGSIGMRCAVALLEGGAEDDAIILQQKAAGRSSLEAYLGGSRFRTGAERVVHGQRLMQAASDIFLGWHSGAATGDTFYWRQLSEMKGEFDTAALGRSGFAVYVAACAGCLARAHGRAGDPALISGYIGRGGALAEAISNFALAYADQTQRDHEALVAAVASGTLPAER